MRSAFRQNTCFIGKGDIQMRYQVKVVLLVAALMCALSFGFCRHAYAGEMKHVHGDSTVMELSHMDAMMSNGLWMVTAGFNMVMLAEMKMVPSVDPATSEHGRQMIRSGREVIEHFMSGSQMKELHKSGHSKDPLMAYSHELGEALMKVTIMMEKMSAAGLTESGMMPQRHIQLIISHALGMAAQGYSMAALGQMSMSRPVDRFSIGEGQMMMTEALWLLEINLEGAAVKGEHKKGVKMDAAMMAETNKFHEAAKRVIDLLEKTPFAAAK